MPPNLRQPFLDIGVGLSKFWVKEFETSVLAVAGWSTGETVSRYTRTLAGSLAVNEFSRVWTQKK